MHGAVVVAQFVREGGVGVGGSFETGRPKSKRVEQFWTQMDKEGWGGLENQTIFMHVICVSSLKTKAAIKLLTSVTDFLSSIRKCLNVVFILYTPQKEQAQLVYSNLPHAVLPKPNFTQNVFLDFFCITTFPKPLYRRQRNHMQSWTKDCLSRLPQFLFARSETRLECYHQKVNVRVASRVAKWPKSYDLRKLRNFKKIPENFGTEGK